MVYSYLATGQRRGFTAHSSRDTALRFLLDQAGADLAPQLHLSRDGQHLVNGKRPLESVFCVFDTEERAREFVATQPPDSGALEASLYAATQVAALHRGPHVLA